MIKFAHFSKFPHLTHGVSRVADGNIDLRFSDPATVNQNLTAITAKLHTSPDRLVQVEQVHSANILIVDSSATGTTLPAADGLITTTPNLFLMLRTADCIPMFIYHPQTPLVALIHAGSKGVASRIHIKAINLLKDKFKVNPQDLLIGLGPAICSRCYHSHEDLLDRVTQDLIALGIPADQIESSSICTCEDPNFYSHQRSLDQREPEGRFASIIGLT